MYGVRPTKISNQRFVDNHRLKRPISFSVLYGTYISYVAISNYRDEIIQLQRVLSIRALCFIIFNKTDRTLPVVPDIYFYITQGFRGNSTLRPKSTIQALLLWFPFHDIFHQRLTQALICRGNKRYSRISELNHVQNSELFVMTHQVASDRSQRWCRMQAWTLSPTIGPGPRICKIWTRIGGYFPSGDCVSVKLF